MKKIIIDVQYGLGNRLRALISAMAISEMSRRELIVVWKPDLHCEATFSDLFIDDLNVLEDFQPESIESVVYDYMDNEKRRNKELILNLNTEFDIYVKSAFSLDYDRRDILLENSFLRKLQCTPEINSIITNYDVKDKIGVHIRMGGGQGYTFNRWDSEEFWDEHAKERMYFWREKSHNKNFINEMKRMLKSHPELEFFVAADLKFIYDEVLEVFPGKIIKLDRPFYDRSKEQQKFGLADIILLSQTRLLLGSRWSTFSEIANRLGGNEVRWSGIDF